MDTNKEFDVEKLVHVAPRTEDEVLAEGTVEDMMTKLRAMQRGKQELEEGIKMLNSVSDSLQKELTTLQDEAFQLEGMQREKKELCRKLQFQCMEAEQIYNRELNQNKECNEALEQYRREIQELKFKHRKQRMKFENQLHQLIDQHKNLHSIFTLKSLPDEIESAENIKHQLLKVEKMKLAQLQRLNEELEKLKIVEVGEAVAETQDN